MSTLQLAMLAAILYLLLNADRDPQSLPTEQSIVVQPEKTLQTQPAATPTIDATLVRDIVRSELDRFAARTPAPVTGDEVDANRIDPVETEARLSWARESILYFRTVGEISEREIDEFQIEIATLDPTSQKAMLSELFGEINKGNVRVRP